MQEVIIPLVAATIGFLAKSAWDLYWKQRQERQSLTYRKRVDSLENQLSRFYWPVYIRLQKDKAVWDRILSRNKKKSEIDAKVGHAIDSGYLLPNHQETIRIIQENIHFARPDAALESVLSQYIRHVAIYGALRESGVIDRYPYDLGEPYPEDLFPLIESRTHTLQTEYDRLVGQLTAEPAIAAGQPR
jgi:hypothetical protein